MSKTPKHLYKRNLDKMVKHVLKGGAEFNNVATDQQREILQKLWDNGDYKGLVLLGSQNKTLRARLMEFKKVSPFPQFVYRIQKNTPVGDLLPEVWSKDKILFNRIKQFFVLPEEHELYSTWIGYTQGTLEYFILSRIEHLYALIDDTNFDMFQDIQNAIWTRTTTSNLNGKDYTVSFELKPLDNNDQMMLLGMLDDDRFQDTQNITDSLLELTGVKMQSPTTLPELMRKIFDTVIVSVRVAGNSQVRNGSNLSKMAKEKLFADFIRF